MAIFMSCWYFVEMLSPRRLLIFSVKLCVHVFAALSLLCLVHTEIIYSKAKKNPHNLIPHLWDMR